jgi:hypothetical protein
MQCGAEDLAHIDKERFFIHWSVEYHGRSDGPDTESGDEGGGFPMTAGSRRMTPLPLGGTPTCTGHGCRRAGFVDTNQLGDVKCRLSGLPRGAFVFDVFPLVLAGA